MTDLDIQVQRRKEQILWEEQRRIEEELAERERRRKEEKQRRERERQERERQRSNVEKLLVLDRFYAGKTQSAGIYLLL